MISRRKYAVLLTVRCPNRHPCLSQQPVSQLVSKQPCVSWQRYSTGAGGFGRGDASRDPRWLGSFKPEMLTCVSCLKCKMRDGFHGPCFIDMQLPFLSLCWAKHCSDQFMKSVLPSCRSWVPAIIFILWGGTWTRGVQCGCLRSQIVRGRAWF